MPSIEPINLGKNFELLNLLGTGKNDEKLSSLEKAKIHGRPVKVIPSNSPEEMKPLLKTSINPDKVKNVTEKICKSIAEVNKIQFRGLSHEMDKHQVRKVIQLQGEGLRHFSQLLHSHNKKELHELADHIMEVYPDENLTYDEALEVAMKLQGIKLKLPPKSAQYFLSALMTPPRALYAGITEVVSGLFAGLLGALWKANLDPSNPIKDPKRPPFLHVHGLMDTQGSGLPLWLMMNARRKIRNLLGKEDLKYGSKYSISYAGIFYNNPKQTVDDYVDKVADKVISIRKQTGHNQIIMQGHSLGGLIINRFSQLQDAVKELKEIKDPIEREKQAKKMRKSLRIEPKIYADTMELAKMSSVSDKKKAKLVDKFCNKLKAKGLEVKDAQHKIEAVLQEVDSEKRKQMAIALADEACDAWWFNLIEKIDPNHVDEEKRSMEAKWLISICTPYDGSKMAVGVTNLQKKVGIPSHRIIQDLKKRSEISDIIGSDARNKIALGGRKVYNIACKTTDEFVSEGSATVNYDYRFTKVFKSLAHVGVLFSPRVANTIGSWLDDIYQEAANIANENKEAFDRTMSQQMQEELKETLEKKRKS